MALNSNYTQAFLITLRYLFINIFTGKCAIVFDLEKKYDNFVIRTPMYIYTIIHVPSRT